MAAKDARKIQIGEGKDNQEGRENEKDKNEDNKTRHNRRLRSWKKIKIY
jgi:hypothetical protein